MKMLIESAEKNDIIAFEAFRELADLHNIRVEDALDCNYNNPLHVAVRYGSVQIIKNLIETTPSLIKVINGHGQTPFELAVEYKQIEAGKYLVAKLKSVSPNKFTEVDPVLQAALNNALKDNNLKEAQKCLDAGANINHVGLHYGFNKLSSTLLMGACEYGYVDQVLFLINNHADIHLDTNPDAFTAFKTAFLYGQEKVVEILIIAGALNSQELAESSLVTAKARKMETVIPLIEMCLINYKKYSSTPMNYSSYSIYSRFINAINKNDEVGDEKSLKL